MKRRYLLSTFTTLLVVAIIGGSVVVALAKGQRLMESSLAARVLQNNDLPGSEWYYSEKVGVDRFPGSLTYANIPFQVAGFQTAHEVSIWYPLKDGQSRVFVLNLAYQYQNKAQAEAVLRRQIGFYNHEASVLPANYELESIDYNVTLASANGVDGLAWRATYQIEGMTLESYYFVGAKDSISVFLMVDGLPNPEAQEIFDTLVTTIIER